MSEYAEFLKKSQESLLKQYEQQQQYRVVARVTNQWQNLLDYLAENYPDYATARSNDILGRDLVETGEPPIVVTVNHLAYESSAGDPEGVEQVRLELSLIDHPRTGMAGRQEIIVKVFNSSDEVIGQVSFTSGLGLSTLFGKVDEEKLKTIDLLARLNFAGDVDSVNGPEFSHIIYQQLHAGLMSYDPTHNYAASSDSLFNVDHELNLDDWVEESLRARIGERWLKPYFQTSKKPPINSTLDEVKGTSGPLKPVMATAVVDASGQQTEAEEVAIRLNNLDLPRVYLVNGDFIEFSSVSDIVGTNLALIYHSPRLGMETDVIAAVEVAAYGSDSGGMHRTAAKINPFYMHPSFDKKTLMQLLAMVGFEHEIEAQPTANSVSSQDAANTLFLRYFGISQTNQSTSVVQLETGSDFVTFLHDIDSFDPVIDYLLRTKGEEFADLDDESLAEAVLAVLVPAVIGGGDGATFSENYLQSMSEINDESLFQASIKLLVQQGALIQNEDRYSMHQKVADRLYKLIT